MSLAASAVAAGHAIQQISTVADDVMAMWTAEVKTLKPAKQHKWKGTMTNQTGVRSQVRYFPEGVANELGAEAYFAHKLSEERQAKRYTDLVWIPVLSSTQRAAILQERSKVKDAVFMVIPEGARGHMQAELPSNVICPEGTVMGGDLRDTVEESIAANHTGKHTSRNHPVSVPTAPGQPVRG